MVSVRSKEQEAAEDVFFGQVVMIWARWFLIAAGAVLVLWTAESDNDRVIGILPVLGLMGVNFFLHGRYLMEKPGNQALIATASMIDVAIITVVVMFVGDETGLSSPFFIMYYPVLLAFAFVMPRKTTLVYTAAVVGAYAAAAIVGNMLGDATPVLDVASGKTLLTRVITLAAMGGLASFYWRIQRDRRHASSGESAETQQEPAVS